MSQRSKVHSHGYVPFSWEKEPGVSKVTKQDCLNDNSKGLSSKFLLPPPPCPTESGRLSSVHDIQIPLPPCAFQQPPSRSSSRKGLRIINNKHDQDPFLVAFKECTKNSSINGSKLPKNNNFASGFKKGMFNFSCKQYCSVRLDNFVRVSQLPCKKDHEEM